MGGCIMRIECLYVMWRVMFALESNMLWCDGDDICSCGSPLPRLCDAEVFVFEAVFEKGMCDRRSRRGLEFGLGWGVWLSSDEKNYLGGDEWADDRMSVEKLEMTAGARDGYLRSRWKRENGEMKMWRVWDETWKRFSISSSWLSFVRWSCDSAWWGACSHHIATAFNKFPFPRLLFS